MESQSQPVLASVVVMESQLALPSVVVVVSKSAVLCECHT
jgi:hypothetical protein